MMSIDGFADIERIGRGGLGDVYRATRVSTGAVVAIKVLRDISDQPVAWNRTRRELTALVSLAGHANVVQLIELLDLPTGPALVMEYAPGGSVADLLARRDGPLSVGETVLIGRQTASALVAAHAKGIVHRDIKPHNLLIDAYGQVKLCDFGIAAMARSEEFQNRTSAISMRYASPEDLNDDSDVGPASDVYSLGATLLHLARGAPPTLKERLAPWDPPTDAPAELAALDAVVAACLRPTPAERPTATSVVEDLERLWWSIGERTSALAIEAVAADVVDDDTPTAPRPSPGATRDVAAPADATSATSNERRRPAETSDDRTVHRDGPRPSSRPLSPSRPRRWSAVVAAAVGVAAVSGVVFAAWSVGRGGQSVRSTIEIVDRPGDLTDITELDWPVGAVGECLVQTDIDVVEISCREPHDLQRIAVGELDSGRFPPGVPFDLHAVRGAVGVECAAALAAFVGVADSEFEMPFTAPSESSWADDRGYQCLLGVGGHRLVGDAAGSKR